MSVLVINYVEDFSGGTGSVTQAKQLIAVSAEKLATAEALFRMADILGDFDKALEGLNRLDELQAECQKVRVQFGLPI